VKVITAVVAGTAGYFVGKFLDRTGVGRVMARAGVAVLDTALTKFNEFSQSREAAGQSTGPVPPQQPRNQWAESQEAVRRPGGGY
jgi:hypothetical protein